MIGQTFTCRMGCDNCGHVDRYTIPVRRIIVDYDRDEDIQSSYGFQSNQDHDDVILTCTTCKLPCLKVFWQQDDKLLDEVPKHQQE